MNFVFKLETHLERYALQEGFSYIKTRIGYRLSQDEMKDGGYDDNLNINNNGPARLIEAQNQNKTRIKSHSYDDKHWPRIPRLSTSRVLIKTGLDQDIFGTINE
nr:14477_t:CDS:2 [Entrophospora candida]